MKKKILTIIFLLLIFLISLGVGYFYSLYKKVYVNTNVYYLDSNITQAPTPTPDPYAPKNVLILGYGGAGHEGGALTDTMILAHIIPKENKIYLISIPRDIWVPINMLNDTQYFKINHAFAIGMDDNKYPDKLPKYKGLAGGGILAKEEVSLVTGLNVDYFISLNFDGFKNIINIFNGVTINVPYSFTDEYYPIKGKETDTCSKSEEEMDSLHATLSGQLLEKEFKCRFETIEFNKGLQELDAESALKFVRSRHSEVNGSDFGRSLRQQALIIAIKDELLSLGSVGKIIPVLNSIAKNMQTDIDILSAFDLIKENRELSDIEIKTISLNTDNVLIDSYSQDKQYILISKDGIDNWEGVHTYIEENLNSD